MAILGIDLGGTKISSVLFTQVGDILGRKTVTLDKRKDSEVEALADYKRRIANVKYELQVSISD